MKITPKNIDQILNITVNTDFKLDLGKEEGLKEFEHETLTDIINPVENYETSRFTHKPYDGQLINQDDLQTDIWFYFYFYNNLNPQTHIGGLDYNLVGINETENAKMVAQTTKSFFRLEFYKVPHNELPERMNRRLVFAKNLSLPLGEKVFFKPLNDDIFVPVFMGSNFRNKENMNLFWFQDDSALEETILTGDTFYMTVRFFDAGNGSILNFSNKSKLISDNINESSDLYYKYIFDWSDYTYTVYEFNGYQGNRIGTSDNPIKFYEIASSS